jgi:hypothetical protein
MTSRVRAFLAFWYDFVIGDDWRVAAGVVVALAITFAVSRTSLSSWWIAPLLVAVILVASVVRATRQR